MDRPSFEELIQLLRTLAHEFEFVRVVMGSAEGEVRFIEVTDEAAFRLELRQAFEAGLLELGLLGGARRGHLPSQERLLPLARRESRP